MEHGTYTEVSATEASSVTLTKSFDVGLRKAYSNFLISIRQSIQSMTMISIKRVHTERNS